MRSLAEWPRWSGLYETREGRGVLRRRIWNEVAVVLRASSKALVVPYGALQLGAAVGLPAAVVVPLALSYLVPWAYENSKSFEQLLNPPTYHESWQRRLPARQQPAGAPPPDDHCAGAARRAAQPAARISADEALTNLLGAAPDRLFLEAGEVCPICLEAFPSGAADIAASQRGTEAAQALAALEPAAVGLRCGHVLHIECAEAAVRVADQRHVRCPLCREPVTLAGSASSRAFN